MFKQEYEAASKAAANKVHLLEKNPVGYFVLSLLAGAYIGFGILLSFTVSGQLQGTPATKVIMGACFGVALSLVIIAGAELFTGNNLIMTAGLFKKKITWSQAIKLWLVCWIGNLAGSVILGIIFHLSGLNTEATATALASAALAKSTGGLIPLFCKGILCNTLVCLAVWCGTKCKSESAKLIMIFWCLLTFFICGFEHSIANMTVFALALLNPAAKITLAGCIYNLAVVTLGNMVGGICCVSLPYFLASKD